MHIISEFASTSDIKKQQKSVVIALSLCPVNTYRILFRATRLWQRLTKSPRYPASTIGRNALDRTLEEPDSSRLPCNMDALLPYGLQSDVLTECDPAGPRPKIVIAEDPNWCRLFLLTHCSIEFI